MMENFFGIMKSELLYAEKFESPEDFTKALEEYIDYEVRHKTFGGCFYEVQLRTKAHHR